LPRQALEIEGIRDFDTLFRLIDSAVHPIRGLGELYVYDSAFRIGTRLNIFPREIYLHAGTRKGARALGLDHRAVKLKPSVLPAEFSSLEPYEMEDILCIFEDELKEAAKNGQTRNLARRKGCN
jgi:hypothetical protein